MHIDPIKRALKRHAMSPLEKFEEKQEELGFTKLALGKLEAEVEMKKAYFKRCEKKGVKDEQYRQILKELDSSQLLSSEQVAWQLRQFENIGYVDQPEADRSEPGGHGDVEPEANRSEPRSHVDVDEPEADRSDSGGHVDVDQPEADRSDSGGHGDVEHEADRSESGGHGDVEHEEADRSESGGQKYYSHEAEFGEGSFELSARSDPSLPFRDERPSSERVRKSPVIDEKPAHRALLFYDENEEMQISSDSDSNEPAL